MSLSYKFRTDYKQHIENLFYEHLISDKTELNAFVWL